MNRVVLIGRLTAKPELRYTGSNLPYTRFSVAVNRNFTNAQGQREADFINIVVWRKQAENVCNFLNKGSLVAIEGRIQTGSYDAQDGTKRYTTDVVVDQMEFLGGRQGSDSNSVDNSIAYSPNGSDNLINSNNVETTDISEDPYKDFGDEFTLSSDDLPF